jgi:hypothetical protein
LLPEILLPEAIRSFLKTSGRILKGSARFPTLHHLLAICVQRFIDNPLCRIDFVVVANPQMPETLCDRLQSRSLGLMP